MSEELVEEPPSPGGGDARGGGAHGARGGQAPAAQSPLLLAALQGRQQRGQVRGC